MPVYTYRCSQCGEVIDVLNNDRNNIPREIKCPECDNGVAKKLLNGVPFKIDVLGHRKPRVRNS